MANSGVFVAFLALYGLLIADAALTTRNIRTTNLNSKNPENQKHINDEPKTSPQTQSETQFPSSDMEFLESDEPQNRLALIQSVERSPEVGGDFLLWRNILPNTKRCTVQALDEVMSYGWDFFDQSEDDHEHVNELELDKNEQEIDRNEHELDKRDDGLGTSTIKCHKSIWLYVTEINCEGSCFWSTHDGVIRRGCSRVKHETGRVYKPYFIIYCNTNLCN